MGLKHGLSVNRFGFSAGFVGVGVGVDTVCRAVINTLCREGRRVLVVHVGFFLCMFSL